MWPIRFWHRGAFVDEVAQIHYRTVLQREEWNLTLKLELVMLRGLVHLGSESAAARASERCGPVERDSCHAFSCNALTAPKEGPKGASRRVAYRVVVGFASLDVSVFLWLAVAQG